jgi:hypothetical protein
MDPRPVVAYFGGPLKTARALRCTHPAVYQWLAAGVVPELRQYQIEVVTRGKFRAPRYPIARAA